MTRSRYKIFDDSRPYFMTCAVVRWIPLFELPPLARIVLDSLTFMQERDRLTLYAYVIMKTHLHIIASADHLSAEIRDFKSYSARRIIDTLEENHGASILESLKHSKLRHKKDRTYQVWQEGSHPQEITSEAMMRQKIEYIHYNPVKGGYVVEPADWRYSSARNYEGLPGLIRVTTEW
jgi:putative transposase